MPQTPDDDTLDWDRGRDGLMADAATPDDEVATVPYVPTPITEAEGVA